MGRYDYGWPAYVPVAERKRNAAKHVQALRKRDHLQSSDY